MTTIGCLAEAGFSFDRVSHLATPGEGRTLYLRHDVDFDPQMVTTMARSEAAAGIQATYYVMLAQHYNALEVENKRAIRLLGELGHEVGLHYDMRSYPAEPAVARQQLDWEVNLLADLAQQPVNTIVMHHPSLGQPDPFMRIDQYVHPHDPRYSQGLIYISDSCRAWRDDHLLRCMRADGPTRVLFNSHPELWLDGSIRDRLTYLVHLRDMVTSRYRNFFDTVVLDAWTSHPASRVHDERQGAEGLPPATQSQE